MSDSPKKLFLLDAYALIFRAYFAFINNPRVTSKGLETSAIFGFVTTLLEVLEKQKPSHIAVVYDAPGKTFRHEEYVEYKAHRDETPEGIKVAVPYIQKLVEAFNIPFVGIPGFEADDVIGTLAKQAEKEGFEVYMMTPDKDFGQLVSENIKMYRPARGGGPAEVWGVPEILAKFDIQEIDQVVDYLGMMGDAADNIPGFPSVGPKTASKLLKQYGSMENMLEHAHEIKGKLGEKIRDNAELGLLSKKLARIIVDVPVSFDAEVYVKEEPNVEALQELFTELEFRTLGKRIFNKAEDNGEGEVKVELKPATGGQTDLFAMAADNVAEATVSSGYITMQNSAALYQLVQNPLERKMLLQNLLKQKEVCFDTETTSLDTTEAELVGIAFSYSAGLAYYVDVPVGQEQAIVDELKPFFENEEILKIGQNLKYDISVLKKYGVEVKGPLFDTMLAHYLLQPDMRHNMDVLAETYLNYQPQSIETLIGKKGKNQGSMRDVEPEKVAAYAGEDADITFQLKGVFEPMLKEGHTESVFNDIEVPLVPVLAAMELEGIRLDVEALHKLSVNLEKDIAALDKEIIELAGESFNIASPKQLGEILFGKMQLVEKPKKTKSGQYATSEDILAGLAAEHRIVAAIMEYRQLVKLKSTYVDALPLMVNKKTGRIHTSFNQAVAATGRLSSINPNLQNIPIRTERGREVRKAFIPRDENHILVAADYSQIELRLIAELSGDKNMIQAFTNGEDIHAATAAKVFGVPQAEVTREQRSNAKAVNFGIAYGQGVFGLAQNLGISRGEAKEIITNYFAQFPGIKDYMEQSVQKARDTGYAETMLGRKRYLKDINARNNVVKSAAERNAINAPIQGSAADIIKIAMIRIYKKLQEGKYKTKMLLQVHDELVFDAPLDEVERIKPMIKAEMENAVKTNVPLIVDFGQGQNWLEAH